MEKRVRLIWILTLVSGLLLVCGQAYWLFNQYRYQADEYVKESYESVKEAIRLERDLRSELVSGLVVSQQSYIYISGGKEEMLAKDSILRELGIELTVHDLDSIRQAPGILPPFFQEEENKGLSSRSVSISTYDGDEDKRLVQGEKEFYFLTHPDAKQHLHELVEINNLQMKAPFAEQRFDSLLNLQLSSVPYHLKPASYANDSTWITTMHLTGTPFRPVMEVEYPYDPLKRVGITIQVALPYHPVLKRMGWQLAGSLGLILLLLMSMLFQVATVVKQYRVDKLRKNFVHTMIHELRRPVQTLKMFVSLLRDEGVRKDERAMKELLRDSMFELDNLTAYLSKLKDMTRAESKDTPLQKVSFDLKELVEKVIRLITLPAGKKVTFVPSYDMEHPCVTADPVHIANMIQNLIENSIKYSTEEVVIDITCRLREGKLFITVSDNGFGIATTEQTRVFEKFYRGDLAHRSDIPGIGLGLSYVKLITEAHQGEVSLSAESGKGTSITLQIPQYG